MGGGGTLCSGGRGATFHVGAIRDGLSGKVTFERALKQAGEPCGYLGEEHPAGGRASSRGNSQRQSLRLVRLGRKETEEVGVQCLRGNGGGEPRSGRLGCRSCVHCFTQKKWGTGEGSEQERDRI